CPTSAGTRAPRSPAFWGLRFWGCCTSRSTIATDWLTLPTTRPSGCSIEEKPRKALLASHRLESCAQRASNSRKSIADLSGFQVERPPERAALVLDLLLQQHDGVNQLLRTRRTAGHVNIHGNPLVHALYQSVIVENASRGRTRSHRDDPLGFRHLHIEFADHRRHLLRDPAGNDHQVRLTRRRAEDLGPKAGDVKTRGAHRHHLDGAAGQSKGHRPNRIPAHPVHDRIHRGHEHALVLLLAKSGPQNLPAALLRSDKVVEALFTRLRIIEVWRTILGGHFD